MFENLQKIEIKVIVSKEQGARGKEQGARSKENTPAKSGHGLKAVAIQFPGFGSQFFALMWFVALKTGDCQLRTADCS